MTQQITTHNLGFPRIGGDRELKKAQEAYWRGEIDQVQLEQIGRELRKTHWQLQAEAIALGHKVKLVILGPLSYLYLGKEKGGKEKGAAVDRFDLLDNLLPAYQQLLTELSQAGAT